MIYFISISNYTFLTMAIQPRCPNNKMNYQLISTINNLGKRVKTIILRGLRTPPTQMTPTLVAAGCGGSGLCGPVVRPHPGERCKCKVWQRHQMGSLRHRPPHPLSGSHRQISKNSWGSAWWVKGIRQWESLKQWNKQKNADKDKHPAFKDDHIPFQYLKQTLTAIHSHTVKIGGIEHDCPHVVKVFKDSIYHSMISSLLALSIQHSVVKPEVHLILQSKSWFTKFFML